jgi:cytochrome c biogenesis protein CcmG, thiol:disulfide interchange protein DsbE
MNWKVLAGGGAVLLPLVALLAAGFGRSPKLRSEAVIGKPAPTFNLEQIQGGRFDLEDYRGSLVVVNFWSTWCQPCKIEHPVLLEAAQSYGPAGVRFVAVVYQDEPAKVQRYIAQNGSAWPTLIDTGGRAAISYGVAGVPETFFIDKEGTIVHKVAGPVSRQVMVETLEPLL